MLKPKFTIDKNDRLMIGEKYFCNGHWLIKREHALTRFAPKAFKALEVMKHGRYSHGYCDETRNTDDQCNTVIPARDEYLLLQREPARVVFNGDNVSTYVFTNGKGLEIGVNPTYVPLLRMGHAFAKTSEHPILVLNGDSLNDDLIGVVMPMRIKDK